MMSSLTSWLMSGLLLLQIQLYRLREGCKRVLSERVYPRLPPGPSGRPIWGILPYIKEPFHMLITKFHAKFGGVVSFFMGQQTMVVLGTYEAVKKALKSDAFVARPKTELQNLLGGYGTYLVGRYSLN